MKVLYFGDDANKELAQYAAAARQYAYAGSRVAVYDLLDQLRANRDSQHFGITRHAQGFILYPFNARGAELMDELPAMARGACEFMDVSAYDIQDARIVI